MSLSYLSNTLQTAHRLKKVSQTQSLSKELHGCSLSGTKVKSLKEQEQSLVHEKPEVIFADGTPQEAANTQIFGLLVRISDRKGLRAVII